jgi:hypothetical protein
MPLLVIRRGPSGRHFVHSVIPAARTLASNLSFPDLQEMMAQRAPTIP